MSHIQGPCLKIAKFIKFHALVVNKQIGKGAHMLRVREDTAKVTAPGGIVGHTSPQIRQVLAMSPFHVWEQCFLSKIAMNVTVCEPQG